jgi:hypothetical protein
MEQRVKILEDQMVDVRERLTGIESLLKSYPDIFATKADLHRELQAQQVSFYKALSEQSETFYKALNEQSNTFHDALGRQTWHIITYVTGVGIALTSAIYFIATHVR